MSDEETPDGVLALMIYVLPTDPKVNHRAILAVEPGLVLAQVQWSPDAGGWVVRESRTPSFIIGSPVDTELGEKITAHAKSLGVEW